MLILGIETSCDETAAALVENGSRIHASVVRSQDTLHAPYRGVVPEIASRAHLSDLLPIVEQALGQADATLDDVDAIAVAHTPGLIGSLLIGLTTAKCLAWLLERPLLAVNHLEAHIYAAALGRQEPLFPCVSLIVSGGHTSLFYSADAVTHELLGATIDDAAGEAFDKVAAILELGYPGGPAIDRAAQSGNPSAVALPRTLLPPPSLDFSFSGIKTAVLYHCWGQDARLPAGGMPRPDTAPGLALSPSQKADIAASFQEAVVDVLVQRTMEAVRRRQVKRLAIGGGVACNRRLRQRLGEAASETGIELALPPPALCLDNAAMVAGIAYHHHCRGKVATLDLDALARTPLSRASPPRR